MYGFPDDRNKNKNCALIVSLQNMKVAFKLNKLITVIFISLQEIKIAK